jgi:anti-sigma factor RsiW
MSKTEQMMTRYLLGELTESEREALERKYFTDPKVFDSVTKAEQELIDNYVRGRLPAEVRARFEQYYLAHPQRRERMKFGEALVTRLDQIGEARAAKQPVESGRWWERLFESLRGPRLALGVSIALASVLVALGGAWLVVETKRLRQELREAQVARASHERGERELAQRVADERKRAEELAAELERLRTQPPILRPEPKVGPAPAFVSLLLTVGGIRSTETGPPSTLVIPPGTAQVRLQLNLKEHDYPSYRAVLLRVGGGEIFSRQGLRPKTTRSGASLAFILPADKFATGDYLLTLRGVSRDGEVDEVSKSLFRVERK